jgi:hypothetical protein
MGLGIRSWLQRKAAPAPQPEPPPQLEASPSPPPGPHLDYFNDGIGLQGKNLSALNDPRFVAAYAEAMRLNVEGWAGNPPDISFRSHICCWAAKNALAIPGDFAECGVHTGILSLTVMHFLDFASIDRRFWLFDTFEGIPIDHIPAAERAQVTMMNTAIYFDCFQLAERNFSSYPNARLVRGILPQTLDLASIDKLAYLSMDLNNSPSEMAVIERLWDKLSPGAYVVLDDYAFNGFEPQHEAWDDFARSKGLMVLTIPTGQGLLIKPAS